LGCDDALDTLSNSLAIEASGVHEIQSIVTVPVSKWIVHVRKIALAEDNMAWRTPTLALI
jgi:hypothetical protein